MGNCRSQKIVERSSLISDFLHWTIVEIRRHRRGKVASVQRPQWPSGTKDSESGPQTGHKLVASAACKISRQIFHCALRGNRRRDRRGRLRWSCVDLVVCFVCFVSSRLRSIALVISFRIHRPSAACPFPCSSLVSASIRPVSCSHSVPVPSRVSLCLRSSRRINISIVIIPNTCKSLFQLTHIAR